ncbi:serine hydrolase [Streptomyces sp. NPDC005876]|uniref:serine hydrolase n=1 Tax=unclassified Streptomyces TaxID=2593676 RepID=UPI0033E800F9
MGSSKARLACAALAGVVVLGGAAAGTAYLNAHADTSAVSSPSPVPASASAPSSAPAGGEASVEEPSAEPSVDRDALLAKAVAAVPVADSTELAVSVLDTETGESAAYGDGAFTTASIVKVDILATLLLQAQEAGRRLTATERTYATAMIENSDNASATALWRTIGRAKGLDAANERFGLTDTEGGDGDLWGLTRTTAADQLVLLRQVFEEEDSELSTASRAYVRGLMGRIAAGQDWGVSAAGSSFALKNGWLPRSATGLWVINSIGRVTSGGHSYLVAALSQGNTTQAAGISLVEAVAKAAVSVCGDSAGQTSQEATAAEETAGQTAGATAGRTA